MKAKAETSIFDNKKIVFIGAGNMAEALIKGILKAKLMNKQQIIATDIKKERLEYIKKETGINTFLNNRDAVEKVDFIVLSIKPQMLEEVLNEIGKQLLPHQLVISIVAGATTVYIEKQINDQVPLIRVMPNIAVLVRQGMSAFCSGKYSRINHEKITEEIFGCVGKVLKCQEKEMDAVTALSGSGPAYLFYLLEILIRAGKEMKLPEEMSQILSEQTILGAINMVNETKISPDQLRERVTSPGGTTQQALDYLEEKYFAGILVEAIKKAKKRAEELSIK
ncbi:pyrroline-5-carboxylate reductase [bacterium]|nr:pyrroline-5-carboxylate reductase [bacterium]